MNKKQRMGLEIRGTESYEAVISSEFPVDRDGMDEVLIHTDGSVDLSRFPLPLLVNHNLNNQIGVVENPRLENGKLIASIRFTNDELGKQYEEDVIDKVRNNLSIGYQVIKSKNKTVVSTKEDIWQTLESREFILNLIIHTLWTSVSRPINKGYNSWFDIRI